MFGDIFSMFSAIGSGPAPIIRRTRLNEHILISTVNSYDMGPETAICVGETTHPILRYKDEEAANIGHEKTIQALIGKKLDWTQLGYGGLVDEESFSIDAKYLEDITLTELTEY